MKSYRPIFTVLLVLADDAPNGDLVALKKEIKATEWGQNINAFIKQAGAGQQLTLQASIKTLDIAREWLTNHVGSKAGTPEEVA